MSSRTCCQGGLVGVSAKSTPHVTGPVASLMAIVGFPFTSVASAPMVIHRVLVVQPLHPTAIAMLEARPDVEYTVVTDLSEQNLIDHVGDADAMTLRDGHLPASVVEAAPNLKIISRHGVGYDNVPLALCTARGIPVTLTVAANAISVAEHTMMLMLAAARTAIEL